MSSKRPSTSYKGPKLPVESKQSSTSAHHYHHRPLRMLQSLYIGTKVIIAKPYGIDWCPRRRRPDGLSGAPLPRSFRNPGVSDGASRQSSAIDSMGFSISLQNPESS